MSGTALSSLASLAEQRFSSFPEAAHIVLDLLEAELPRGAVLLGRLDRAGRAYWLIEVRGAAAAELRRDSALPMAGDGDGLVEPGTLAELGAGSCLAIPLEPSTEADPLALCALSPDPDAFTAGHRELLAVAGRLLLYEWEWRADVRRLTEELGAAKAALDQLGARARDAERAAARAARLEERLYSARQELKRSRADERAAAWAVALEDELAGVRQELIRARRRLGRSHRGA